MSIKLLIVAIIFVGTGAASGQDSGTSFDALVRKKLLTTQEAAKIRAEIVKEVRTEVFQEVQADLKLESAKPKVAYASLAPSTTELKLYGDLRLRYNYVNIDPQVEPPQNFTPGSIGSGNPQYGYQASTFFFRLRLNADYKLNDGLFGGVGLQTSNQPTIADQTLGNGLQNYNIYISRAFVGWKGADWLTVVSGKMPNPLYTTQIIWSANLNPAGASEKIEFDKLFASDDDSARRDKQESSIGEGMEPPWTLALNSCQFIVQNNTEDAVGSLFHTDVWQFVEQLVGTYKLTPNVKITLAPGYMRYTSGNIDNSDQALLFGYNRSSVVTGTGTTNGVPTGVSKTIYTIYPPYGESGDLSILTFTGDIAFKNAPVKTRLLWDFAYNTRGQGRFEREYQLVGHEKKDDVAWLAGFELGENQKKGDWMVGAQFIQIGMSSVDPNLILPMAFRVMNTQVLYGRISYNLSDNCIIAGTYYNFSNLRKNLSGGEATSDAAIANTNSAQLLYLDLSVRF